MEITSWLSASGKTKYFGILFADGHVMPMPSKKKALAQITYIQNNLINNNANSNQQHDIQPTEQNSSGSDSEGSCDDQVRDGDQKRLIDIQVEEAAQRILGSFDEERERLDRISDTIGELERVNRLRSALEAEVSIETTKPQRQLDPETIDINHTTIE